MELVVQAEELLLAGDVQQAQALMFDALSMAPRDAQVLTAFGSMLAEIGNIEKAVLTLQKAVRIEPSTGYEKFMCARPPACFPCSQRKHLIAKRQHPHSKRRRAPPPASGPDLQ